MICSSNPKRKIIIVVLLLIISGLLLSLWKNQEIRDVRFTMKVDGIEDSTASMVLYWDIGDGIDGEKYLSSAIVDGFAEVTIPKEIVKKSVSYRFDPINLQTDCSIAELKANDREIKTKEFNEAISALGQVEIDSAESKEYQLSVSGNDPQIYLGEEFAKILRKASEPSWGEVLLLWGVLAVLTATFLFVSNEKWILWVIISCVFSYVLGGIDAIYTFDNSAPKCRIMTAYVVLLVSAIITYFGIRFRNWDVRLKELSWRGYWKEFKSRYHISYADGVLLVFITLLGGILRGVGYNWGLITTFQADECKLVEPAMEMAINHTLYQRSSFYYPDQFTSKIASILIAAYSKMTGTAIEVGTMVEAYFLFRIVIVICGTLTIVTAFLIGNYFEKHLGVILAGLVSVFPVYVNLSKQVTGDTTVLFFLTLTILFSLRYMEEKKNIFLALMSMGAAMATLEKWHGAVGIGFIGFVVLFNSRKVKELFYKGVYALAAYFAWLVVLAPNMMFHLRNAIVDGFINIAVYDDSEGQPFGIMLQNYGKYGVEHIGGLIYIVALLLGLIYIFVHFRKQYTIFLLGIVKTIILCFLNRQFVRWGLELYFTELIIASIGILWIIKSGKIYWRVCGAILCCIIGMDFASGAILDVAVAANTHNDTRMVQRRDCEAMGAMVDNTISAAYTGYVSGGWCDKVYGDEGALYVFWEEYFEQVDGVMYRKKEGVDYVVMNVEIEGTSWVDRLKEFCPNYWEYEAICEDNLDEPIQSTKVTLNDINLISQNLDLTKQILGGAMSGRNIIVFDVRNLPYLTED